MMQPKMRIYFFHKVVYLLSLCFVVACSQQSPTSQNIPMEANRAANSISDSLYSELGGKTKISEIAALFLEEVSYHPDVLPYFQNTNITRFEEKFIEHLCLISGGPCQYTGDTMEQVHAGMNVTEADFNAVVDLMINAMSRAGIAHKTQNKLLARLVPMRKDIIYK